MSDIYKVLRAASWRLMASAYLRAFVTTAAVVLGGLIVLRLVQKLAIIELPWWTIATWCAGGVAVLAAAWTVIARADRQAVARRVDEGADLRETLSTALWVGKSDDPWAKMTLETASARARGVDVRRAVPIQPPRFWPVPLALGLALLVVWLTVPNLDWFGRVTVAQEQQKQESQIIQAKFQAEQADKKVNEILSKLGLDKEKGDEASADDKRAEVKTPEEIRREASKRLTSLKDKLESLKNSDKGQALEALKKDLRQLKTPGDGPLTELSMQLAKGNFDKASEELQKAMEKMQAGKMSEEDKAKMAEQLKSLKDQLEKLAAEKKELEDSLEKAGLDKKLAANPEALKKALEQAEGLTEEQKEQLEQQSKAQSQCSSMCQSMSESMSAMAQGMSKEGMSQEGMEGMEGMMGELAQLEQMASEMASADAAMSECENALADLSGFSDCDNPGMGECEAGLCDKMGTKPWEEGWSENQGWGQGGPGRSAGGGNTGEKEDVTKFEKKKSKTINQGGPIISSRMVQGEQVKGESKAEFAAVVEAAEKSATEAIEGNMVPREYQDTVKHYFGRLQAKAKAEDIKGGAAAPAPAPATPDAKKDEPKKEEPKK